MTSCGGSRVCASRNRFHCSTVASGETVSSPTLMRSTSSASNGAERRSAVAGTACGSAGAELIEESRNLPIDELEGLFRQKDEDATVKAPSFQPEVDVDDQATLPGA